ncbi:MAG: hypothetical protein F6J87_30020 [Spirulina sp. SIO3F2]|nr:hypothetical protein [Spirulina sp. SIO3F2]
MDDRATTPLQEYDLLKDNFYQLEWLDITIFDWEGKLPKFRGLRMIFTYWESESGNEWTGALYCDWNENDSFEHNLDGYAFRSQGDCDMGTAIKKFKQHCDQLCFFLGRF